MVTSDELMEKLVTIEGLIRTHMGSRIVPTPGGQVTGPVTLDGPYGDPVVKDPPRWVGQSHTGKHMSECSAEFLLAYAGFKDWCAGKDEESGKLTAAGKPAALYSRLDAARARAHAANLSGETEPF